MAAPHSSVMLLLASDNELMSAIEGFFAERYWRERIADAERGVYIGAWESKRILSAALNAED